jgi:uroporphyrinogen decarboxylase
MTKHERVVAAITGAESKGIPSCFSLHFPKDQAHGVAGVQAHLDFFKRTDTDILKIMNEHLVPPVGEIRCPGDWNKIPSFTSSSPFIKDQIEFARRIADRCDPDGFTLGTLHGICASAIHPIESRYGYQAVRELQCAHLRANPKPVLDAFARITEGMCILARAYGELGLDGVYYAGLGAENHFFTDEEFAAWIAPFDKEILSAVKSSGGYTFLHMCKENLNMNRYASYAGLSDVVNWGVHEAPLSLDGGRTLFPDSCVMGGLANRSGILVEGSEADLSEAVKALISAQGGKKFILGADCTLPTEISYERIRVAVDAARRYV